MILVFKISLPPGMPSIKAYLMSIKIVQISVLKVKITIYQNLIGSDPDRLIITVVLDMAEQCLYQSA
jgi:hypothetical protein